jgi:hypothetical protein
MRSQEVPGNMAVVHVKDSPQQMRAEIEEKARSSIPIPVSEKGEIMIDDTPNLSTTVNLPESSIAEDEEEETLSIIQESVDEN